MGDLKVTLRNMQGRERLCVELPNGVVVAWLDRTTDEVKVFRKEHEAAAIELLAPYLQDPQGRSVAAQPPTPPPLPPLTPVDDLASNRPGETIRNKLATEGPGPVGRLVTWLLRRESEWDSWRTGLVGERRVGAELDRLSAQGWSALHSILLRNSVDIDHLLIGPGGVFSINTKHYPNRNVWVGNDSVTVDHGPPHPYTRRVRAEARRVQRVLTEYSGGVVDVQPALVFVGVIELDKAPTLDDVHVWRQREVASVGSLNGKLTPEQVNSLYAIARHRRVWADA